jgi:hypothetical protein
MWASRGRKGTNSPSMSRAAGLNQPIKLIAEEPPRPFPLHGLEQKAEGTRIRDVDKDGDGGGDARRSLRENGNDRSVVHDHGKGRTPWRTFPRYLACQQHVFGLSISEKLVSGYE